MPHSPATRQLIEKWLKERCPSLKCGACNGTSLDIEDIVVCAPKTKTMGALVGRGPTLEFVPLVCVKCGFVMFFSVRSIGLTV